MNSKLIDIHTHSQASLDEKLVIRSFRVTEVQLPVKEKLYSFGIHPCDKDIEAQISLFDKLMNTIHPQAVGECGLDKNSIHSTEMQLKIYRHQAIKAKESKLPMIIHCVGRFDELLQLRKSLMPKQTWVIHGFTGHPQMAEQLIQKGFLLSFGNALLTGKGKAQLSLSTLPSRSFFLETDDASAENLPAIYERAAAIRNCSIRQLKAEINELFQKIFGQI
jgi:TatD DNase family protein